MCVLLLRSVLLQREAYAAAPFDRQRRAPLDLLVARLTVDTACGGVRRLDNKSVLGAVCMQPSSSFVAYNAPRRRRRTKPDTAESLQQVTRLSTRFHPTQQVDHSPNDFVDALPDAISVRNERNSPIARPDNHTERENAQNPKVHKVQNSRRALLSRNDNREDEKQDKTLSLRAETLQIYKSMRSFNTRCCT